VIIWQSARKRRRGLKSLLQALTAWWYVDRKY